MNYANKPIRLRAFVEAFDIWRTWNERAQQGGLEADEVEDYRAAEGNMISARDALED